MRLKHFDGIRFFLFSLIFIAHWSPPIYGQLGYSLPMFFILSGFLVSYVLSGVFERKSLKSVLIFYCRRALRTLPSYYIFIAVLIGLGLSSQPQSLILLYYNMKLFFLSIYQPDQYNQISFNFRDESISLWSICVEEQFYLIFPIIYYFFKTEHHVKLTAVILALSFALKVYFINFHPDYAYGTILPLAMEPIGWGILFYLLEKNGHLKKWNHNLLSYILLISLVLLPIIESNTGLEGKHYQFSTTYLHSLFCALGAAFVWTLWKLDEKNIIVKILSFKPFVYLGQISYGLYLTHLFSWPVYNRLYDANYLNFPHSPFVMRYAITIVMGMISWHLIDKPVSIIRDKLRYN